MTGCTSSQENSSTVEYIEIPEVIKEEQVHYPIDNFETGIKLKPFGIYIQPSTSPVQPERFSGYHTGADIEAPVGIEDVWVHAIGDGEVLSVKRVDGYGGVIQIKHDFDGDVYTALYGHIDLDSSLVDVGNLVSAGDQLAILGDGYSVETDGERKHLHFSLKPGLDLDLSGYVQNKDELTEWINPELFKRY
jgi:murein DD-endopeptidase MepM/ murein hydrolase activator NlpD